MYKKIGLSLIPLIILGCGDITPQTLERPLVDVDTLTIETTSQPVLLDLPGHTNAFREAEVRPQVDGIVLARLFKEGSFVEKGQSLYQIDPAQYEASLLISNSKLEAAKASLGAAKAKLERTKQLVKRGAVSKQKLDDDLSIYEVSLSSVHVAEASQHQAEINLEYTKVRAPISGVISHSYVSDGALVSSGQEQMLAKIQQLNPINVDLNRSSSEVARLQRSSERGDLILDSTPTVSISLGDDDEQTYKAKVKFTEANINPKTDSVILRAEFPNQEHKLLPGMYIHARLNLGRYPQAILVPQKSVSRNSKGEAIVMLVTDDSKVERRVIKVAEAIGKYWRVTSGLNAGDEIVTSNLQRIRSGDQVNVDNTSTSDINAPSSSPKKSVPKQQTEK
ncbi:efflux transporter periplasmic adaptor subunit [Vibrio sp. HI00D65]|uniref:efflux RND transporter periplasmic adaptor subunit n=1 Tax=Vibrio sp. HI00D65 TaxID=1822216 RepID=UPI0007B8CCCB|nr:efflux RND transporter periplasmic adaptor subunit [Vibrio sp. HI00D65]KZX59868.1 efflux transporter periplasmic adaptor subunit [Vibrio sp. HI00D65]